jgi:hypothetical protein
VSRHLSQSRLRLRDVSVKDAAYRKVQHQRAEYEQDQPDHPVAESRGTLYHKTFLKAGFAKVPVPNIHVQGRVKEHQVTKADEYYGYDRETRNRIYSSDNHTLLALRTPRIRKLH